jgi:hypothetical protein
MSRRAGLQIRGNVVRLAILLAAGLGGPGWVSRRARWLGDRVAPSGSVVRAEQRHDAVVADRAEQHALADEARDPLCGPG